MVTTENSFLSSFCPIATAAIEPVSDTGLPSFSEGAPAITIIELPLLSNFELFSWETITIFWLFFQVTSSPGLPPDKVIVTFS